VYAAQIFEAASPDAASLDESFARGDFNGLREWLRENIHRHGMRYRSSQLIERIAGRKPDASVLIAHLASRYA
jgi:carboxypeptidase Taq